MNGSNRSLTPKLKSPNTEPAYYLGLSALAGVVTAAVWTGFVPPTLIDERVFMILVVVAFGLSAVGNLLYNRRYRLDRIDEGT